MSYSLARPGNTTPSQPHPITHSTTLAMPLLSISPASSKMVGSTGKAPAISFMHITPVLGL